MLYRIEGTDVKIAGAPTAFTLEKPLLPSWLQHVFNDSDKVVFEADIEKIDPSSVLLTANQSLTVLSFYSQIADSWERLQITGKPNRFKAWAAAAQLSAHLSRLLAPGVEQLLLPEAKRRQYPPEFLEFPQDRIDAFDAVTLEEQLTRLEHLVTQRTETISFDLTVHQAWLAHNLDAMNRLLDSQKKAYPEFFLHTLDHRHSKWLPELIRIVRESSTVKRPLTTLILMEPLHLCGERGIVSLMSQEGHKLTRLL